MTRTFDLAALGLLPRPVPPGDAARVWPKAWLAVLDAAEGRGWCP